MVMSEFRPDTRTGIDIASPAPGTPRGKLTRNMERTG
jgi:hypothetical protein